MWLSDLSIRQPVFITMLVLAVLVIGALSYSRMGLDLFPNMSFPLAVVQTMYPGASPEEVERSVTKPIEDAVISINGVDTISSTSMDSVSMVIVLFKMDVNDRQAVDDVRMRVNMIRNGLPTDVKDPVILRFDPGAMPVLSFAVADPSGKLSSQELRTIADDQIKPRLEQVSGVAGVTVSGGVVREVHVDLSAARLQAQGVSPQQVTQAIGAESLDVPAGRVADKQRENLVRTLGQVRSLAQLGDIPVLTKANGVAVKVKDLATTSESQADVRMLSRLDGEESVVGQVQKQSGANAVQVADAVKGELNRLRTEYPDLSFAIAYDSSTFTRQSVNDVQSSMLIGAILAAIIVLLFFRDLRNTLVTVAGLPVVVMGTFTVLYALGLTLNMITLMALSLSVGMLIDDAIVVRENIFRHMERGEEPRVAASRGTGEIALAVVAVTSTIVAVFLPIAFTGGIAGLFLRDFGITITAAVGVSLIEAFTLAPMLSAYFFKRIDPANDQRFRLTLFTRVFGGVGPGYRRLLGWALGHRLVVAGVGIAVFVASLGVLPLMQFSFVPDTDQGQFSVGIELPPGSRLTETDRAARAVEQIVRTAPEVEHVFTTVGSSDGSVETASVNVRLRTVGKTNAFLEWMRPQLQQSLVGVKYTINRQSSSPGGGGSAMGGSQSQPISFAVQGNDQQALDRVSAELVARFQQIPGAIDVDRSTKPGKPSQAIVLDRAKATDLAVSTAGVGSTIRALVNGTTAGTFRAGDKDLNIVVRLEEADRADPSSLLRLPVMTTRGNLIPLSQVASVVESSEPNQIRRENRLRQITVGANYLSRDMAAVQAEARAIVNSMELPPGVSIKVGTQQRYQDEMLGSLGLAFGLSVLFVYMILASQFGSFVHPFTIMLALPFSIVGALLALFVSHFNFDMLAAIGIILLMGLVTKNSILLVDFTNQLRRRGYAVREAILEAGPIRLRPILMTTLSMIFGMVPVAVGLGAGSELRRPMGMAVIGGLITSTLLTLVVVPVVYSLIAGLSRRVTGSSVDVTTEQALDAGETERLEVAAGSVR
jgi:hydrophobic/amphiphilic exporter-1 (mainly G- bacteria), HAE1 family